MVRNEKVFTRTETLRLAFQASSIAFDLSSNILENRDDSVKRDEVKLRLFRKYVRLLMHTELVLDEMPSEPEPSGEPMSIELRELYYWLLGNRSNEFYR